MTAPATGRDLDDRARDLVLVVEDDAQIAEIIRLTLEDDGLSVALAYDGEQAVRMGLDLRPALVLLDVMLPLLSGDAVAARLQEQPDGGPPLVLLSASADVGGIAHAIGAVGFISKPFDLDEIVRVVRQTIRPALANHVD